MSTFPISAKPNPISDAHQRLTEAHCQAAALARSLQGWVTSSALDLAEARVKTIKLGLALDALAKAEHDCGPCSHQDHLLERYQQMLEHHRQAYLRFEHLASEMEDYPSVCPVDAQDAAAEIVRHLNAAEESHQASLTRTDGPRELSAV